MPTSYPASQAADDFTSKAATLPDQLRESMVGVQGVNPDEEARNRRLAGKLGLPVEVVRGDTRWAEDTARLQDFDPDGLSVSFPTTAQHLADPSFAAVAHDSAVELSATEAHIKGATRYNPTAFAAPSGPNASLFSIGRGLADQIKWTLPSFLGSARAMWGDVWGLTTLANEGRSLYETAQDATTASTPEFANPAGRWLYGGAASTIQSAPGIGLALTPLGAAGGLAFAGLQSGGQEYMTVQQRGGSKAAAATAAAGTGAVEVLTEFLPMSYLADKFGKAGMGEFLSGLLLREMPGEQIATFAQDAIDVAADNPNATWSQFWAERPEAAMATAVAVAMQSGTLGGLSVAARRLQRDTDAAANAQATQQFAQQLDEIATASKVRERDPSSFETFINSAAEDTPVSHIYVAATDLAQTIQAAGENAPQLINELSAIPSIAGQLPDMLAAGGDIKVPVGEWAAYAAGSELSQQLLPHLRTNPFDMSMRQAEEFMQTAAEGLQAQVQQAVDMSAQQAAFATSSEAVRTHFADQLKAVNRFTADVNDLYAQLLQSWYSTAAQRTGVTPEDMLKRYPLEIQAQGVEADALTQPKVNANGYVRTQPDAQGFLTLSHWSDKGRLKQLDPEMWGENWDVLPDEEKVRVGDAPGRVYWGVGTGQAGQYQPEYGIGNHRYEAKIEASKLYDIDKDPLKLRRQAQANIKAGMDKGEKLADYAEDITTEFEKLIQAAGFAGYQSHSNQIGHVAAVFEPLKHTYKGRWAEALAQAPVPAVGGQASIDDFTPEALPELLTKDGWALLTAENPAKRTDVGPEDNARLNAELVAELERRGIEHHPVEGHYGQRENSFIAFTDEATALELGALFGQESVLNRRGLLYMDGTIDPAVGVTVHDTRPEDFYTYVPETDALFTIDIAFAEGARPVDVARQLHQSSSLRAGGSETLKKYGLEPGRRYTTRQVAAALEARTRAKFGTIGKTDRSPAAVRKIAKWISEEVKFELQNPEKSGAGWYSYKFQEALDAFGGLFPELKADKTARDVMTALIAVTSDGQKVVPNFAQAADLYASYRETGKFATSRGHVRQGSIDANVAKIQELYATMAPEQVRAYLMQTATVSQLKKLAAESGLQFSTSYQAHIELPLAAVIFGPKLGAFYANLMGAHGYLTMDRWWSRTFNRYRGTLLQKPTREGLDRFKQLLAADQGVDPSALSDDEALAGTVSYRNAYAKRGFKDGSEIEKAANTIYKAAFENLEDQPFSASDRTFMLSAVSEAQKSLAKDGVDISVADIQAVLWYYEKRLYGDLGARDSADISYKEAAERVVASLGGPAGQSAGAALETAAARDPNGVSPGEDPFSELEQAADKAPRGSFNPSTLAITLLKDADLSTFLHETGHFFLEAFADMAKSGDPALAADWAEASKFMGFPGMAPDVWLGLPLDQRREGHERWARGFEAYLFEGKAPAAGLRAAFQKFRAWLLAIYKQITNLNVELTPEVRGVFDRMLAAGNEIALYEEAQSYAPLFKSAEEAGMTKEEWEAYQQLGAEATQTAAEALQTRSLRDMQWLSRARDRTVSRLQREASEKRKAIRQEVTAEVMDQPINRVRTFLKRGLVNGETVEGPTKLDVERVKALYAHLPKELQDFTKLGYGRYGMLAAEGVDPDLVADMFGFTSGHELVEALLNAPDPREEIAGLTDQRMLERYGDLADKASIDRAADEAIHNDARLKFVATEANALAKAAGTTRIFAAAARDFARQAVARQKVRDLRPSRFGGAEVRSAREAAAAAAKGDLVAAATAKRNQLVNGYAAKAAADARAEVEKAVRYFATLQKEGTRKAIDPDYLDQVDALLDRFDLRRGVSLKAIDKRKSLLEWVEAQKAMGLTPVVPDELLDEAKRKHYRDLTVEELRGVVDSVRNIVHLGRLKKRLLNEREKRALAEVTSDLADSIARNAVGPARRELENNTLVAAVKSGVREFFAMHRKLASLARQMDGLKDGGPMWQVIIRPMNEAGGREAVMREEATIKLSKLFEPLLAAGGLKDKVFIKEIDASLSLEGRLAVALNWGNETNRARIMDGDKWSPDQVDAILRTLSPEHFAFVQQVWDYVDTFWPQIAAKERRVTGVEPEKVERDPVTVTANDGSRITLEGGYYPIKYDPRRSGRSEGDSLAEVLKQRMEGASLRATTRRGHTKARVDKVERPVLKEFGVLFGHVNDVIHDLAWHEFLIDANRILRSDVVDQSIRGFLSPEVAKAIRSALDDIAVGDTPAANVFERSVNYLRSGATVAGLGWNLTTALLQPLGLSQSMVRIGPKWVARGMARIFRDATSLENTAAWVNQRSSFMRLRAKTMQREISELRNKVRSVKPTALTAVEETYFVLIAKMQLVADLPTWVGQYEKSMAAGEDEAEAAALADQAVLDAQGGGQIKDLAGVQRGNVLMKLWTNFYSFFNVTYNQLAESAYITRKLGPSRIPGLAADTLMLLVVPSILATALRTAMSGDDWEDFWAKAAKDEASYLFGLMVGLREFGSILASDGSYSSLAGLRFLNDANKLVAQAKQGEADASFWRALNNTAGVLLHYPAGQVNRTVSGFTALANGETRNPLVLVTGPPKAK